MDVQRSRERFARLLAGDADGAQQLGAQQQGGGGESSRDGNDSTDPLLLSILTWHQDITYALCTYTDELCQQHRNAEAGNAAAGSAEAGNAEAGSAEAGNTEEAGATDKAAAVTEEGGGEADRQGSIPAVVKAAVLAELQSNGYLKAFQALISEGQGLVEQARGNLGERAEGEGSGEGEGTGAGEKRGKLIAEGGWRGELALPLLDMFGTGALSDGRAAGWERRDNGGDQGHSGGMHSAASYGVRLIDGGGEEGGLAGSFKQAVSLRRQYSKGGGKAPGAKSGKAGGTVSAGADPLTVFVVDRIRHFCSWDTKHALLGAHSISSASSSASSSRRSSLKRLTSTPVNTNRRSLVLPASSVSATYPSPSPPVSVAPASSVSANYSSSRSSPHASPSPSPTAAATGGGGGAAAAAKPPSPSAAAAAKPPSDELPDWHDMATGMVEGLWAAIEAKAPLVASAVADSGDGGDVGKKKEEEEKKAKKKSGFFKLGGGKEGKEKGDGGGKAGGGGGGKGGKVSVQEILRGLYLFNNAAYIQSAPLPLPTSPPPLFLQSFLFPDLRMSKEYRQLADIQMNRFLPPLYSCLVFVSPPPLPLLSHPSHSLQPSVPRPTLFPDLRMSKEYRQLADTQMSRFLDVLLKDVSGMGGVGFGGVWQDVQEVGWDMKRWGGLGWQLVDSQMSRFLDALLKDVSGMGVGGSGWDKRNDDGVNRCTHLGHISNLSLTSPPAASSNLSLPTSPPRAQMMGSIGAPTTGIPPAEFQKRLDAFNVAFEELCFNMRRFHVHDSVARTQIRGVCHERILSSYKEFLMPFRCAPPPSPHTSLPLFLSLATCVTSASSPPIRTSSCPSGNPIPLSGNLSVLFQHLQPSPPSTLPSLLCHERILSSYQDFLMPFRCSSPLFLSSSPLCCVTSASSPPTRTSSCPSAVPRE
ncbi:unnamed protein product [Closterium sp. NIES-65]|nr:unnamed protein product [Closterium sp. NIES-65]